MVSGAKLKIVPYTNQLVPTTEKVIDRLTEDLGIAGCRANTPSVRYTRAQLSKAEPLEQGMVKTFRRFLGMELYLARQ